jgi:hypothetical protein
MLRSMPIRVVGNLCATLALAACFSGCAYGELSQVLRSQVASEADCPDVVVQRTSPYAPGYKDHQYQVKGCGVDRVYTCKEGGLVEYSHADCTFAPAGGSAPKPGAAPTPSPDGDDPDMSQDPLSAADRRVGASAHL